MLKIKLILLTLIMNKVEPRSVSITDMEKKLEIFTRQAPSDFVAEKSKDLRKQNSVLASNRLHDPHVYQYRWTRDELYTKLQKVLTVFKDCFNTAFEHFEKQKSFMKQFSPFIPQIEERLLGMHVLMITCILNLNVFDKKHEFSDEDIDHIIDKEVTKKLDFNHEVHRKSQIVKLFERMSEVNYQVKLDYLTDLIDGKQTFCYPAVFCILEVISKILDRANKALSILKNKPKLAIQNKILLKEVSSASKCFILFYSAMCENPNDIFYQNEDSEDLQMLLEVTEFHEPYKREEHYKCLKKGNNLLNYFASIASHSMKKTSFCCLFSSFVWNGFTYKFTSDDEKEAQSQLALSVLDKEAMGRMFGLKNKIDDIECRKDSTCKTNELIYIPIYEKDCLTVDNLSDTSTPEMITNNIDIAPLFKVKKYDPTTHVRVRIICDYADPKWLKKCKNDEEHLWEIENIFIDFHGGGFLIGNSNDHGKKFTSLFAKNFEGPVFSIDYRLAPKYQYPDPLNDSWQAYCWITKYAEKYLKIKFKNIFVLGDSAGGNLALGITTLAIQKNVRVPDGVILTYPAIKILY